MKGTWLRTQNRFNFWISGMAEVRVIKFVHR